MAKRNARAIRSTVAFFNFYISFRDETKTDEERRRVARGITLSPDTEVWSSADETGKSAFKTSSSAPGIPKFSC